MEMPKNQSDRRASPRYGLYIYVRNPTGEADPFVKRRGNIGIGGFCFEDEAEYEPGAVTELLFHLPGTNEWIHVRGKVLGSTDIHGLPCIRGRFQQFDFEDERRLARWIDKVTLQRMRRVA